MYSEAQLPCIKLNSYQYMNFYAVCLKHSPCRTHLHRKYRVHINYIQQYNQFLKKINLIIYY